MTRRENILKAIRFETPEYIPMDFVINDSYWNHYPHEAVFELIESHPLLFPDFKRPERDFVPLYLLNAHADKPYTDPCGCVWMTAEDGITGAVHGHPLDTWEKFRSYNAPDPEVTDGTYPVDWNELSERVKAAKERGEFVRGGLPHGHTFLRLQDIRGYENFIFDMVDEVPEIFKLVGMVEDFNYRYIQKWIDLEPDMLEYPEDLGMQRGPMLSPDQFRKYIKPSYQRLMKLARERGIIVHMHSDGDIRTLADDLVEDGVDVINLQDRVNGIDWIAETFSGKICVDLDVDRQEITHHGTPGEIDVLIREEVEKIGSRQGGLMMIYGLYPGVSLENACALMDAMEKYRYFYS